MKTTKILIIGQCTLHWGRMEFGNIGNYYILEPLIKELHHTFNNAEIKTSFQLSERFQREENIKSLPMEIYYSWSENDLAEALKELASATIYNKTNFLPYKSEYIKNVLESDFVIDFSGDIWGDNANFLGENRFLVGLIKDRVAQLLRKKTFMIAGSPGPFENQSTLEFAKEVYQNFDLVTNRESISIELLKKLDFNTSKTVNLACPAFLFDYKSNFSKPIDDLLNERIIKRKTPLVGFILCGWNFLTGPFDKENRTEEDYKPFAELVEYIANDLGVTVCLMSHSNGFPIPPKEFKLIHGRDYKVSKELNDILIKRNITQNFFLLETVLDAWQTKFIVGSFDMLVSGRIHGAVAGLSQLVPTVIIDYGHEPKAHKLRGFAIEAGVEECVVDPIYTNSMKDKISEVWKNRILYKDKLSKQIPIAKNKALDNFKLIYQNVFGNP